MWHLGKFPRIQKFPQFLYKGCFLIYNSRRVRNDWRVLVGTDGTKTEITQMATKSKKVAPKTAAKSKKATASKAEPVKKSRKR